MAKKINAKAVTDGVVGSAIAAAGKNNYTPKSNSTVTLRTGSSGTDVEKLQTALADAGYYVGNTGADGIYGKNTAAAVKKYQQDNGLAVDGIAGKNTLGSLYSNAALDTLAAGAVAGAQIAAGTKPTTLPPGNKQPPQNAATVPTKDTPKDTPKEEVPGAKVETKEEPKAFAYDDFNYGSFSYGDYYQSDTVNQANALLQQHRENQPGAYQSQWQDQIDAAFDAYNNRDPFSYDFNSDALYQQYKDNYIQQGQMAMMDTMGQAAAMTGGYGNSYAQTVGQQAYNQQLNQLNDVMPELYQQAYNRYDQEGTDLYNQYNMLLARENKDYARYQDNLSNWYKELDYLTDSYDNERKLDYDMWQQGRTQAYNEYSADRSLAYDEYNAGREKAWDEYLANKDKEQSAAELMAGLGQYDRLGDVYGLTDSEVAAIKEANTPKVSYSGGTPTPSYNKLTDEKRTELINIFKGAETTEELAMLSQIYNNNYNPAEYNMLAQYAGGALFDTGSEGLDTNVGLLPGSDNKNMNDFLAEKEKKKSGGKFNTTMVK